MKPLVYRGRKEICAAVGISWQNIGFYIEKKALPVFKIDNKGPWLALPEDLEEWIEVQRCKELGKR